MSPFLPASSQVERSTVRRSPVEGEGAHDARREEGAYPLTDIQPTWWGEAVSAPLRRAGAWRRPPSPAQGGTSVPEYQGTSGTGL